MDNGVKDFGESKRCHAERQRESPSGITGHIKVNRLCREVAHFRIVCDEYLDNVAKLFEDER